MSMSKFAAGIGAAALAAAMSFPVSALAAPMHRSTATARSGNTEFSSARRYYHHGYRHWGYHPYRYGYRGWRGYPSYAYGYGGYGPYWGGPHAYVSLPFVGFSIW